MPAPELSQPLSKSSDEAPEQSRGRFFSLWARWSWLLLAVPFTVGVYLRVDVWWRADALRADEVAIATSVTERGWLSLATRPLEYLQSAPPGWLWIEHAMVQVGGLDERMLHLPQLIADLAAILVLGALAVRLLPLGGAFVAVTLAATNQHLIFYSTNLKQYSFEVLAAICLLAGAVAVNRCTGDSERIDGWWRRVVAELRTPIVLWWLGAAVALAVSQTSAFVTAGLAGVLGLIMLVRRQWGRFGRLLAGSVLWWAALALDWTISLRHSAGNVFLFDYWRRLGAFPGPDGISWRWATELARHATKHPLDAVWGAAALVLLGYGAVRLLGTVRQRGPRGDGLLVLAPMAAAFAVSAIGIYPLWERAALWLVPGVLLLAGAAVDGALRRPIALSRPDSATRMRVSAVGGLLYRAFAGIVGIVVLVLAMGTSVVHAPAAVAATSATLPKIRPLLDGIRERMRPGDIVVVDSWALAWTRLYWREARIRPAAAVYLRAPDATCRRQSAVDVLTSAPRVWMVVINDPGYRPYVTGGLEAAMRAVGTVRPVLRPDRYTAGYLLVPRQGKPKPSSRTPVGVPRAHSCLTLLPSPVPFPVPG